MGLGFRGAELSSSGIFPFPLGTYRCPNSGDTVSRSRELWSCGFAVFEIYFCILAVRMQGLGFRVGGLGFRMQGLGFRI